MSRRKPAAVSLEIELYERSRARAKSLGFATWSAYVVQLIRSDLAAGGGMSVVQEDVSAAPQTEPWREVLYQPEKRPGGRRVEASPECAPLIPPAVSPSPPVSPSPIPPETANVVKLPPQHLVCEPKRREPSRRKHA